MLSVSPNPEGVGRPLVAGLFVKGVFVSKILLAIVLWIAFGPLGTAGARRRCAIAGMIGIAAMIAGAVASTASVRSRLDRDGCFAEVRRAFVAVLGPSHARRP